LGFAKKSNYISTTAGEIQTCQAIKGIAAQTQFGNGNIYFLKQLQFIDVNWKIPKVLAYI
jgi:hypothetical protein